MICNGCSYAPPLRRATQMLTQHSAANVQSFNGCCSESMATDIPLNYADLTVKCYWQLTIAQLIRNQVPHAHAKHERYSCPPMRPKLAGTRGKQQLKAREGLLVAVQVLWPGGQSAQSLALRSDFILAHLHGRMSLPPATDAHAVWYRSAYNKRLTAHSMSTFAL